MNHVPTPWLRRLNYTYAGLDILFIAIGIATHLLHYDQYHWGFDYLGFTIIGIHFVYATVIYPFYQKKNPWQATIISQILFDFIFALFDNSSHETNYYIRGAWILTVGMSSQLGVLVTTLEVAVDTSMDIFTVAGIITQSAAGQTTEWIISGCVALSGFIGWLITRRHYVRPDEYIIDDLNTTLAREKSISSIVIQSINDGIIVFDSNNKIRLINPAAATMTEWKAEDAQGIDIHLVVKLALETGAALPSSDDIFSQTITKKEPISRILQLNGQNNKLTTISLSVSPVIVSSGKTVAGAVAVFRDVTDDRKEEHQRAEFISTASHEMRTPVAAIEGYLALALNDKVSTIDTKARSYLEKAHESTQHLGQLFQDLLTSAKAEDGRLSNHPEVIEIGVFLEQLVDGLIFVAQKKGLAMKFVIGSNEIIDASVSAKSKVIKPVYYAYADPDRLREVITNLFDNAVKYTDTGEISLGLTGDSKVVQFYIRDTGPGIPAADVPHLFQKFYRVDNSATRTIGGTGLGLFICRKIIELYSGRIWVESKVGSGSTFFIDLPRLTPEHAENLKTIAAATAAATPALSGAAS